MGGGVVPNWEESYKEDWWSTIKKPFYEDLFILPQNKHANNFKYPEQPQNTGLIQVRQMPQITDMITFLLLPNVNSLFWTKYTNTIQTWTNYDRKWSACVLPGNWLDQTCCASSVGERITCGCGSYLLGGGYVRHQAAVVPLSQKQALSYHFSFTWSPLISSDVSQRTLGQLAILFFLFSVSVALSSFFSLSLSPSLSYNVCLLPIHPLVILYFLCAQEKGTMPTIICNLVPKPNKQVLFPFSLGLEYSSHEKFIQPFNKEITAKNVRFLKTIQEV